MRETTLNKLINIIKNKRKESDISNTLLRFCQIEAEKLLEEEKKILQKHIRKAELMKKQDFLMLLMEKIIIKLNFLLKTNRSYFL